MLHKKKSPAGEVPFHFNISLALPNTYIKQICVYFHACINVLIGLNHVSSSEASVQHLGLKETVCAEPLSKLKRNRKSVGLGYIPCCETVSALPLGSPFSLEGCETPSFTQNNAANV